MQDTNLLRRLERLERENRRWKRISTAALLAGVAVLAGAWRSVPDEVEASRFVLRGPDGEEAAVLGLDGQGSPSLLLSKGATYAFLTLSGPGLLLRGEGGKRGAFLGFDTQGNSQLTLATPTGAEALRLGVKPDGSARVSLMGTSGYERVALGYSSIDETANLVAKDPNGKLRGVFGIEDGDKPGMVMLDDRGVRRLGMLVDPEEEGVPFLGLQDAQGRGRVEVTTGFDGTPHFVLRRADGQPSFQAP